MGFDAPSVGTEPSSLPENDEMPRILRAMQFLTLLIYQAPARLGHGA
jgi:hypothetical protein